MTNYVTLYSGKEIVQVYYEAPQGKLGKPIKSLAAFVKTSVLLPGQSEQLSIQIPVDLMSSYDDAGLTGHTSAYVLEEGTYYLYTGNSVRRLIQVDVSGKEGYVVESTQVTQQLEQALAPMEAFTRMSGRLCS